MLQHQRQLEIGYKAEDIAFNWLESNCRRLKNPPVPSFADHNDAGFDIVIHGVLPGRKKTLYVEVKGMAESIANSVCVFISRNESRTMQESLDPSSRYDYIILVVDEVSEGGKVCGFFSPEDLLKLKGWITSDQNDDVKATEFLVKLRTSHLTEPHELFVSL